jgi:hypothetical protein
MNEREWVVAFDDEGAVETLHQALFQADVRRSQKDPNVASLLVDEFKGMRVEVFAREHPPPHFRISCGAGAATFEISDCSPLAGDLRRYHRVIRNWHHANRSKLIDAWNRLRPSGCPVGEYEDA